MSTEGGHILYATDWGGEAWRSKFYRSFKQAFLFSTGKTWTTEVISALAVYYFQSGRGPEWHRREELLRLSICLVTSPLTWPLRPAAHHSVRISGHHPAGIWSLWLGLCWQEPQQCFCNRKERSVNTGAAHGTQWTETVEAPGGHKAFWQEEGEAEHVKTSVLLSWNPNRTEPRSSSSAFFVSSIRSTSIQI